MVPLSHASRTQRSAGRVCCTCTRGGPGPGPRKVRPYMHLLKEENRGWPLHVRGICRKSSSEIPEEVVGRFHARKRFKLLGRRRRLNTARRPSNRNCGDASNIRHASVFHSSFFPGVCRRPLGEEWKPGTREVLARRVGRERQANVNENPDCEPDFYLVRACIRTVAAKSLPLT